MAKSKSKQIVRRDAGAELVESNIQIYGKVPPHDLVIEKHLLGTCMTFPGSIDEIIGAVSEEVFYLTAHQEIWKALVSLHHASQPLDTMMVAAWLEKSNQLEAIGGRYYLTALTNTAVSAAFMENYARVLTEKFIQRRLINICGQVIHDAYEHYDAFELLDEIEKAYFQLASIDVSGKGLTDTSATLIKVFQHTIELKKSGNYITGVRSGFMSIDRNTYGWQPTDLIILAARPSVGKTAFMLNLARNAARDFLQNNKPDTVVIFSLEMSKDQLLTRIICNEAGIRMDKVRTGKISDEEEKGMYEAMQRIARMNIWIDDTPVVDIRQLRAKVRRHARKTKVGLVIIDYLQLMVSDSSNNKNEEIGEITRGLKHLAKEVNIPVIALSQLSRKIEDRKGPPLLSDLRDSGAIEQDADSVFFLFRPEHYNPEDHSTGTIFCKCAKQRNGVLFTASIHANLRVQRFDDDKELADEEVGWKPNDNFTMMVDKKTGLSDLVKKQQDKLRNQGDEKDPEDDVNSFTS